jgi:hypothetical protein
MRKTRERLLIVPDDRYEEGWTEVYEAAETAPDQLQAGVEAIVELAEENPQSAREGLWRLLADWKTRKLLEPYIGGDPDWAALRLGAAIQLARAELASSNPRLRRRLPEIMRWLGRPTLGERPELVAEKVKRHRDGDSNRLRR